MFYRINGCNMIIYVKSMILLLLLPADFSNITHVELMFVTLYREHRVHPIDFVLFYFIVVSRQLWLLTSKGGRFDMKCYFTSFYFSFYSFSSLFSLFLFSSSSLFFLFLSLLLKAPAWKNCLFWRRLCAGALNLRLCKGEFTSLQGRLRLCTYVFLCRVYWTQGLSKGDKRLWNVVWNVVRAHSKQRYNNHDVSWRPLLSPYCYANSQCRDKVGKEHHHRWP